MAVTLVSDVPAVSQFTGDGTSTSFAVNWPAPQVTDVDVFFGDGLIPDIAYSLMGIGENAGFTLIFDAAPLSGTRITVARDLPYSRLNLYGQQTAFTAQSVNAEFARGLMLIQQLRDKIGRALLVPVTDNFSGSLLLPDAADRAGGVLAFDQVTGEPEIINSIETFYQGPRLTHPETRWNGTPLQSGDIYLNTSTNPPAIYAYHDGLWTAFFALTTTASVVTYNNLFSALAATDVQNAIDEIDTRTDDTEAAVLTLQGEVSDLATLESRVAALEAVVAGGVPTGTMIPYAGSTQFVVPAGFLLCAGQEVDRTVQADLFAVIGTTYGDGDGIATFNLPDLRGRVVAGKDNMTGAIAGRLTFSGAGNPGIDGQLLGAAGGTDRIILTTPQLPSHTHGLYQRNDFDSTGSSQAVRPTSSLSTLSGGATVATGSGQPHPNVQPTIVANYLIKT